MTYLHSPAALRDSSPLSQQSKWKVKCFYLISWNVKESPPDLKQTFDLELGAWEDGLLLVRLCDQVKSSIENSKIAQFQDFQDMLSSFADEEGMTWEEEMRGSGFRGEPAL